MIFQLFLDKYYRNVCVIMQIVHICINYNLTVK